MPRYVHVPSSLGISLLGFIYPLGSDFELKGEHGTHHLMEHLICKSFDSMLPRLKRLGIDYDAYTCTDRIGFYFMGLSENLEPLAQELYSKVTSCDYTWTKKEFDTEKMIVLQEYGDAFNSQMDGTIMNLIRKHWDYFDPIGLRGDIQKFSYEESLAFRGNFENPNLVCQVGAANLVVLNNEQELNYSLPKFGVYENPQEIVLREGKVLLGLLGRVCIPEEEINRVSLVLDCLNDGLEAPLYQEVREKSGLTYFSMGELLPLYGVGVLAFLVPTSKCNRKSLKKIYKDFFSGDLSRHITQERFEDCLGSTRISKKMGEILPHVGAINTVLENSPYEGLEGFTYSEAMTLLNKYFKFELFEEVEY